MIDPKARTVRLRHEPRGFVYELRGDHVAVDVVRVDQLTRAEEVYGSLEHVKGRWRACKSDSKHRTDVLQLVARAWNFVPLLKTHPPTVSDAREGAPTATRTSRPAPPSGTRGVEGSEKLTEGLPRLLAEEAVTNAVASMPKLKASVKG